MIWADNHPINESWLKAHVVITVMDAVVADLIDEVMRVGRLYVTVASSPAEKFRAAASVVYSVAVHSN